MMLVMVRVMVVRAFLLAVDADGKMRGGYTALHKSLAHELYAGDSKRVQLGKRGVPIRSQLEKRGGKHVARGSHLAVYVKRIHFAPFGWLMRLARKPAPKPLSMFTTLTPAAYEFSMARSAVTPPNDDP